MRTVVIGSLFAALLLTACGESLEPIDNGDGRDESFELGSGAGDGLTPEENSGEARAILEVVNTYSTHKMVREVGLFWNGAHHLVEYRNGADRLRNTEDDQFLRSMGELDDVPYIGPKSLKRLREFVHTHDMVEAHEVHYDDVVPAKIKTAHGAAFRGKIGTRDLIRVPFEANLGDRVILWLRKAGSAQWNPKIKIVDTDTGETVAWANPWGNSDARFPESTEEASRGWEIEREPANYAIVLDNTSKSVDGEYEFLFECVGGPCFASQAVAQVPLGEDLDDLEDAELRAEIVARHESTHTYLDYYHARYVMFSELDNEDGIVRCAYTGKKVRTDDIPENAVMNAEHSWPQSKGAVDGAARSDLHHLFPVDGVANSTRAAYPYCDVEAPIREIGPATYGLDADGNRCFQPRAVHKGNAARAMFYFAAVYQQQIDPAQEAVLRRWHEEDPVSRSERSRNARIEKLQGSRNPFVDDPHLVDRIADF